MLEMKNTAMTIRPIIFSAAMVRALLDGSKTQTRRILKRDRFFDNGWPVLKDGKKIGVSFKGTPNIEQTHYRLGDLLYVRENCAAIECDDAVNRLKYAADGAVHALLNFPSAGHRWMKLFTYGNRYGTTVPPIHMPRWASRLTLEVTGVKVERLQDISEDDAVAEGIERLQGGARVAFQNLWDSLNEKRGFGWRTDPWVIAVSFKVHKCNADSMEKTA